MKKKLDAIYAFLLKNKIYNKKLQEKYYKSIISHHNNVEDKVVSLLYSIANTQSQPKINYLAKFFKFIYKDTKSLKSFKGFVKRVSGKENGCYNDLFEGLNSKSGWGEKTSALFTKSIFNLHNGKYSPSLIIWRDAPGHIDEEDKLYLPVDAVIKKIFTGIGANKTTFKSINDTINEYYKDDEIVIWDDLWFWGFINQMGSGENRKNKWNPNKYWSLEHSDKNECVIKEIEERSKQFRKLLTKSKRI